MTVTWGASMSTSSPSWPYWRRTRIGPNATPGALGGSTLSRVSPTGAAIECRAHGDSEAAGRRRAVRFPPREIERGARSGRSGLARDGRAPLALRGDRERGHGRGARDPREPAALRPGPAAVRAALRPDGARGAAARDGLAVVLQGHRHRPAMRPRLRAPGRARDRLPPARLGPARARAAVPPRPDDRECPGGARGGGCAVPPRRPPRARGDRRARPGPCRDRGGEHDTGSGARRGRGRLPAGVGAGRAPQPDRRRAHDVRAGELGALSPQDLQRLLGRRRPAQGPLALPDDPRDGAGEPGGHGERLHRQRRGHGGCASCSASSRSRRAAATATPAT